MKIKADKDIKRKERARNLLYNQALDQEKLGDFKKALEFYRMSLKIDANFFDSWLNAGAIYARMGKHKKAIICYQRALMQKPDKRAYYNLASEYFKVDRFDEARQLLVRATKLDPHFLSAHLLLGYCLGKLNENHKAEISIKNVLKIDPHNRPAITALALLYFHTGKLELCEKYLLGMLKLDPNDLVAKRLKANLKLRQDNLEDSIMAFKDLAKEDPKIKEFYYALQSWHNPGQKKNIETKKKKIAEKENKDAKDLLDLSLMSLFEGNADVALDYLLEANASLQ